MNPTEKWAGARQMLRHLRDVNAAEGSPQERLDRIVHLIAAEMKADVCSIYVRRAGDVLELFATEGLRREAVHVTRLRVGEGVVGEVAAYARSVALADARSHPSFAYRPETGEELFQSLMAVPILRGGRLMGVLVVQSRETHDYSDEEVETLETVAMVVAEIIAAGGIVRRKEQAPADGLALTPLRLEGVKLAGGLSMGRAVLHRPMVPVGRLVAEDPDQEKARLDDGLRSMHAQLDDMLEAVDSDGNGGDHMDVLRTYRMIAEDRGWIKRIHEAIETGLTAEAAVVKVQNDTRARMAKIHDAYLRERVLDLEDIAYRLLQHLSGQNGEQSAEMPDDVILIARTMGPAELLDYDRTKLRGVVLEEGSSNAHVAIVARALEIPVIGRAKNILNRVEPYDRVIVDGNNAVCFIRPGEEFRRQFEISLELHAQHKAELARDKDLPSVTRDGEEVGLFMNAGLLIDLPHLHTSGAKGVGLYRTEVPFMVRSEFPDIETQIDQYTKILDQAEGKSVTFRTFDIGGDKVVPYFEEREEENPAMGWRAIRISLDRPAILRQQLRAMLLGAQGRPLRVMFPMVAEVAEFDQAVKVLHKEMERCERRGIILPEKVDVGTMLEVPALAFQLPTLLDRIDFLSIGSNDLAQFLFACDRGNPRMDRRYDTLSPALLSFLKSVVSTCDERAIPVTICGEMAGSPLEAMALIGVGFRALSMQPASIGEVRRMVRSLSLAPLREYVCELLKSPEHSIRGRLRAFARDHGIVL